MAEYAVFTCPAGKDVVVIANETPAMVSVKLTVAVSGVRLESLTMKVSEVPDVDAVGIPVIAPLASLSESPAGKVPFVSDHEYGVVPPVAANAAEYALLIRPLGSELVVITTPAPAGEIVNVRFAVAVDAGWLESFTMTVSLSFATAADGVPLIVPAELFRESPAGRLPLVIDHAYGAVPPLAVKMAEYEAFTSPVGNAAIVIATVPLGLEELDGSDAEVLEFPAPPPHPAIQAQITIVNEQRVANAKL